MPLSKQPLVRKKGTTVHAWGLDKSGKSDFALSAPNPCLINFDRSADFLLEKRGLDILRDRIIMPLGELSLPAAQQALLRFEGDMMQAKAFNKSGACDSVVIDGGSLLVDIITMVKLDEAKNPNKTYRYAERNSYIKNLFNDLNESGLNVIWTSKARPVWVAEKKIPNLFSPDCHDDIPFMVDVNVQFLTEPSPEGLKFYGVIGTNAYNPVLTGKRIADLKWDLLMSLCGRSEEAAS